MGCAGWAWHCRGGSFFDIAHAGIGGSHVSRSFGLERTCPHPPGPRTARAGTASLPEHPGRISRTLASRCAYPALASPHHRPSCLAAALTEARLLRGAQIGHVTRSNTYVDERGRSVGMLEYGHADDAARAVRQLDGEDLKVRERRAAGERRRRCAADAFAPMLSGPAALAAWRAEASRGMGRPAPLGAAAALRGAEARPPWRGAGRACDGGGGPDQCALRWRL